MKLFIRTDPEMISSGDTGMESAIEVTAETSDLRGCKCIAGIGIRTGTVCGVLRCLVLSLVASCSFRCTLSLY